MSAPPQDVAGPSSRSRHGLSAQALYWRLPYALRRQLFRALRPRLAAHYEAMRNGRAGEYALGPMLQTGCLFVHIPKCAGIAVNRALYGGLGGGHLPVAHYQLAFEEAEYARLFKFTVVRNPFDRLRSAYRFLAGGGLNDSDAQWAARTLPAYEGFSDFVERWLTPARAREVLHFRPQVDFLRVPGRASLEMDSIARQERLSEDFARLCDGLALSVRPLAQENCSGLTDTDYRSAYSPSARAIAAQVYAEDLAVLGYTF